MPMNYDFRKTRLGKNKEKYKEIYNFLFQNLNEGTSKFGIDLLFIIMNWLYGINKKDYGKRIFGDDLCILKPINIKYFLHNNNGALKIWSSWNDNNPEYEEFRNKVKKTLYLLIGMKVYATR